MTNCISLCQNLGPIHIFPSARVHDMGTKQAIYIYKITCTITGRIYIGQSINPQQRYKQHMQTPPTRMKADIKRYIP
jgi:hypothetical protein